MKNPFMFLYALSMAGNDIDKMLGYPMNMLSQRGYYHRYTGKSKTFKKNKRRGL